MLTKRLLLSTALVLGTFALALIDASRSEVLLATDHIGTQTLCHADTPEALVFASTIDAIDAFSGVRGAVDSQAIYDYVYFHMIPGPRTIRAGVEAYRF